MSNLDNFIESAQDIAQHPGWAPLSFSPELGAGFEAEVVGDIRRMGVHGELGYSTEWDGTDPDVNYKFSIKGQAELDLSGLDAGLHTNLTRAQDLGDGYSFTLSGNAGVTLDDGFYAGTRADYGFQNAGLDSDGFLGLREYNLGAAAGFDGSDLSGVISGDFEYGGQMNYVFAEAAAGLGDGTYEMNFGVGHELGSYGFLPDNSFVEGGLTHGNADLISDSAMSGHMDVGGQTGVFVRTGIKF